MKEKKFWLKKGKEGLSLKCIIIRTEKPLMPKSKPLKSSKKNIETAKIEDNDDMNKYFDDI